MYVDRMALPPAISEIRTVVLLTVAAILAGCETAKVSEDQFLITRDDVTRVRPEARTFQLGLPNGNTLRFMAIRDARGELIVHGLVEHRRAGNRGFASVPGLSTASLPEVYYALAEPNAEIPELLRLDRYPDQTRSQGWARDIVLAGGPTGGGDATCSEASPAWTTFRQEVIDQGYGLVFLSAADGAVSKPSHWHTIPTDWMSPDGHELRGSVEAAAALYVSVLRCEGSTAFGSSWGAPRFSVVRRLAGTGDFQFELEDYLPDSGDQVTYMTPESTLGTASDYRVSLRHYEGSTRFHFGAAWTKPSETFSPGS